jgi:hypothetical protein
LIWSKVTRMVRTANAQATVNCARITLGTANVTGISRSIARPGGIWNKINSARPITSGGSTIGMSSTASTRLRPGKRNRDSK